MSALNAAALASLAGWIEDRLSNENADRQTICEEVAARLRDMAAALRESARPAGGSGPFQTQREAANAARHIIDSPPGTGAWTDGCHRLLGDACRAAGVQLGAYDRQILLWVAGWEPWTVAVVAGLITRGHAGVVDDDRRIALDALDVAADELRDRAANCSECDARPEGLCPTCESRMDRAEGYDRVAARLRGDQ